MIRGLKNTQFNMIESNQCPLFSRLVDRYLIDGFSPQRLSTYALNLFRHRTTLNEEKILIGKFNLNTKK